MSLAPSRWVAHRGASADYPENSLAAIGAALDAGAAHLELDVQVDRDGEPWVIHDPVLMRTSGRHGCVQAMSGAELAAVSVHEPGRFGDRFLPTPIPRLREVVDRCNRQPGAALFVEVKRHSLRAFGVADCLRQVVAAMAAARFAWTLISFDAEAIAAAAGAGAPARGWVLPGWDANLLAQAAELAPDFLFVNVERVPPGVALPGGPWRWVVYEVADPALGAAWLSRNASLIETNAILAMLGRAT